MARSFAKILTSIWDDEDFVHLSSDAKLLYFHLVSRRDVSMAGHVVMREQQWAMKVFDGDTARLELAMAELTDKHFVIVDRAQLELLIRTFIRHDGGFKNSKMAAAIRSAIHRMESPSLRRLAEHQLDACLGGTDPEPPGNRRSDERSDPRSEGRSDDASDRVSDPTYSLKPADCSLHPSSVSDPFGVATTLTLVPPAADDGQDFASRILDAMAKQRAAEQGKGGHRGYIRTVRADIETLRPGIQAMLHDNPHLTDMDPATGATYFQNSPWERKHA